MIACLSAFRFLTICPFLGWFPHNDKALGRSVMWFPIVGATVGALMGSTAWFLTPTLGPSLTSILTVLAMVSVSGGLHCDGLADMGDGFFSSRPKPQILEIMRDSRIGTMGALMLISILALKFGFLAELSAPLAWKTIALMPLAGRCAIVWQLSSLDYARPDGGLCSLFVQHRRVIDPWLASLVYSIASVCLFGPIGISFVVFSRLALAGFNRWCQTKIGGFTGDTLGASCELIELSPAIVALILMKGAWI